MIIITTIISIITIFTILIILILITVIFIIFRILIITRIITIMIRSIDILTDTGTRTRAEINIVHFMIGSNLSSAVVTTTETAGVVRV